MILIEILLVFLFAIAFTGLLVGLLGWRHPRRQEAGIAAMFVFGLLFLLVWAASLWVVPVEPGWTGGYISWVFLITLLLTLFLAALIPPRPRVVRATTAEAEEEAAFGLFFWLLIGLLILLIIFA